MLLLFFIENDFLSKLLLADDERCKFELKWLLADAACIVGASIALKLTLKICLIKWKKFSRSCLLKLNMNGSGISKSK